MSKGHRISAFPRRAQLLYKSVRVRFLYVCGVSLSSVCSMLIQSFDQSNIARGFMTFGRYKLSVEEAQNLIGPAVIGVVIGSFAAYAVVAFASEYRVSGDVCVSLWSTVAEAILVFLSCVVGTISVFGLAPIVIGRLRSFKGDA